MASHSALMVVIGVLVSLAAGLTTREEPDRIVGGQTTTIERFPYQVGLIYNWKFLCGASILSDKFILTAAHCIVSKSGQLLNQRQFLVRAGSTRRSFGGQLRTLAAMAPHPRYGKDPSSKSRFDAAVLKLSWRLALCRAVRPVNLVPMRGREPTPGTVITLTGWGDVQYRGGDASEVLRMVQVRVTPHYGRTCAMAYQKMIGGHVTDEMFCAAARGKDSCQGDSGGPAVDNRGQQVGIVSYAVGCANPNFDGVYTNLVNRQVRQFISQALRTL